jgi:dipeptidase
MKLLTLLVLSNFIISTSAFAHGEDKYGPNKGYIKMPGSFHTEVIPATDGSYRVYLLDLSNKNPTVKDSTLEFQIKDAEVITVFDCKPVESSHFNCISKNKIENKGQIILTAKRLGIQAKPTTYDLPLKLKNEKHDMSKMKM